MAEHTAGRDGHGQYVRTIEAAQRDADAARKHATGWSYSRIGEHFGVNKRAAIDMVARALAEAGKADRDAALALELTKLDAAEQIVMAVFATRHMTVSNGKLIYDPRSGEPLEDDGPLLAAVDRWLRIAERRSKLVGLDAPTRSTVTVITEDVVDAEIARLEAEVARRAAAAT